MKTVVFSAHRFEQPYLLQANNGRHELTMLDTCLNDTTARLAEGHPVASIFVNDHASASVLELLYAAGVRYLTLRSTGFNNVDLRKSAQLGLKVSRVPDYSPYSVAEHTIAMILALNRKIVHAHNRIMELNFTLDGLVGFDLHEKTAGIIGTGKIGSTVARILSGFGCKILAYDIQESESLKTDYHVRYTDCHALCSNADIITLHAPLTDQTSYLINRNCIGIMKQGAMLINTSRGRLVETTAVIEALKSGQIGYFGMDVYEEEEGLFFEGYSQRILQDDTIARLMTFPNVLITSHQAFLTDTALKNIAKTTIENIDCYESGIECENEIAIVHENK